MELCPKGDLRARIDKYKELGGGFTEATLTKLFIQLVIALDVLHANKFVHRNLKPENVIVNVRNDIKISDYSYPHHLPNKRIRGTSAAYYPSVYVPPEVMQDKSYDSAADMWELGVLLYELSTLVPPFHSQLLSVMIKTLLYRKYAPIPSSRCPAEIIAVVRTLLNPDPRKRPSTRMLLRLPFVQKRAAEFDLLRFFPDLSDPLFPAEESAWLTEISAPEDEADTGSDWFEIFNQWLGNKKRFILLYKASKDGFEGRTFYKKCENYKPTVTIITSTEGYVFGGYTEGAWRWADPSSYYDYCSPSFLFSLKNPRNAPPEKFELTSGPAISCHSTHGPAFGSGTIQCAYEPDIDESSTCLGYGYANPTGLDGHVVFTGKWKFRAREIEVYGVQ